MHSLTTFLAVTFATLVASAPSPGGTNVILCGPLAVGSNLGENGFLGIPSVHVEVDKDCSSAGGKCNLLGNSGIGVRVLMPRSSLAFIHFLYRFALRPP